MAKRRAEKPLNQDNWDADEPKEEAGTFTKASSEVLQNRVIKTARRSITSNSPASSPFASFKFSSTNGNTSNEVEAASSVPTYAERMTKLNESLLTVMKNFMENSPHCDFRPTFEDYKKHVIAIESGTQDKPEPKEIPASKPAPFASFSFGGSSASKSEGTAPSKPPTFSFGTFSNSKPSSEGSTSETATSKPAFTFGSTFPATNGFSGDAPKPFSFADSVAKASASAVASTSEATTGDDNEPYVPPTPEDTEVDEPGAVYNINCKLFYKKDQSYVEKGVGVLFLKKTEEGKPQLIIRAKTKLGNILLNVVLRSDQYISRMGKNNVATMCIPNPPVDPKAKEPVPTLFLIRVKDAEKADALKEKLESFIKET